MTGGKVTQEGVKIHNYFASKHAEDCVHLLVDTTPGKDGVAVSAVMRCVPRSGGHCVPRSGGHWRCRRH